MECGQNSGKRSSCTFEVGIKDQVDVEGGIERLKARLVACGKNKFLA